MLPALIRKAHEVKESGANSLVIWGSGTPRREFLHVEDLADACVFLLQNYSGEEHVNIGSGDEITIQQLAELVCEVVGFEGDIVRDTSKPDGTPRKPSSSDRLVAMGWRPRIGLRDGIERTYHEFFAGQTRQHE